MTKPLRTISVATPDLSGNEETYLLDCLRSTWISSRGEYIHRFERSFGEFCGARHALVVSNGTAALHLALMALGIGPGDEVIVPTLTYVASANAVRYCGATPRFADSDPSNWNLDPADVERRIGPATRAIMPVHLFGAPAPMEEITTLAAEHGLRVIEDAAEAHGALYDGKRAGTLSDIGIFSFYGNKIITTGEGGAVVTNDDGLAERTLLLRDQGEDRNRKYWFPEVGFNYRMTNVQAAIGLAQLERADATIARLEHVARRYRERLSSAPVQFQEIDARAVSANWMTGVLLPVKSADDRDAVGALLAESGIETRPFFYPVHSMPPYARAAAQDAPTPAANDLAARGMCLPTHAKLSDTDIDFVSDSLVSALDRVLAASGQVSRR